jgi:hypothetical protein
LEQLNKYKMKKINENIKPILALIIVVMSYLYFFGVSFLGLPENSQILMAIVGTLGFITGYYFASSHSSAKKDETIANMSSNNSEPSTDAEDLGGGGIKNPKP